MSDIVQVIEQVRPLRDPVLITGFLSQRRGGRLASNLLAHLAGEWHGQLIAKIQGEDFYDFTILQPNIRLGNERAYRPDACRNRSMRAEQQDDELGYASIWVHHGLA
jgi:hypothetical protein